MNLTTAIPAAVLRSEWIKLQSVRSTYVTMSAALALGIGDAVLSTASVVRSWATMSGSDRMSFDPVGASLEGLSFGVLAFGVLGVLTISTEYGSGLIRSTLVAVPRRRTVFAAKAAVLGALTLTLGEVFAFVSFFAGQAILARADLGVSLSDPGVLRAVASAGLYLAAVALIGLGLGGLLRHSAGATAAMFAVIFLAYGITRALESWSYVPSRLVLSNAADVMAQTHAWAAHPRLPSLALSYLDLALYVAVLLTVGAGRASRDA